MKALLKLLLIVLAVVVTGVSASYPVSVLKDEAKVYSSSNRRFNEPLFTVSTQEVLTVLGEKWGYYKVTDTQGRTGWIEKSECRRVKGGVLMTFDALELSRYLDNPSTHLVIGYDTFDPMELKLERSFKDALLTNVDRETLERIVN